jgi:hypothetical protein
LGGRPLLKTLQAPAKPALAIGTIDQTVDRGVNKRPPDCVYIYAMSDITFPIEFIGGSRDGEIIEATAAPDYLEVIVDGALTEIYERQNNEPPFVYVQTGYAKKETWK